MTALAERRLTPWVGRLLAVNAVILLLQETIFTSPYLASLFQLDLATVMSRPWTLVTYMFMHGGVFHLAANSLALFTFGPPVERRFGSRAFILYYLYCGVAAAAFWLALSVLHLSSGQVVGASGAIIGVAYAFAWIDPEAPLLLMFFPAPIRAKRVILLLAAYDVIGLFFLNDGIAHGAHLGGLLAGAAYFVVRGIGRPIDTMPIPALRPRVSVAARGNGGRAERREDPDARPIPTAPKLSIEETVGRAETAEIDRVLDKISATGIASLTAEERSFLDVVAQRRRGVQ